MNIQLTAIALNITLHGMFGEVNYMEELQEKFVSY